MVAITWSSSDLIALGALSLAALTIIANWFMQRQRLSHERETAAKGMAATACASAWLFVVSLDPSAGDRLALSRDGEDELADLGQRIKVAREQLISIAALAWNSTVLDAALAAGASLVKHYDAFVAAVTSTSDDTRRRALVAIENGEWPRLTRDMLALLEAVSGTRTNYQ